MMRKIQILVISLSISISLMGGARESSQPDVGEIVAEIDELYRSESSYAELEMEIVTPHWKRTLKMKSWSKGMEKTFIRILAPAKEKGVATLRIENEMWNYLPKTNKVIKVPPSMMMSSWMGSDFTNDDLVREFTWTEDYNFELIRPEYAKEDLLYIKLIPKEGLPIVWGKIILAARKKDYIPVWEKYYDEKDKLMRLMNFKEIKTFDGKEIPAVMELIPQNEEGHKTVIRYNELEFNVDISEDTFSLRNLRSRR
ncbi:MAG: outer membrane lipoprotein-sorting protein [candidate division KSB1 bacterium]|nr:outer membrane lipoprotein-sorting protein [candidate division KSB1 bacterium]